MSGGNLQTIPFSAIRAMKLRPMGRFLGFPAIATDFEPVADRMRPDPFRTQGKSPQPPDWLTPKTIRMSAAAMSIQPG